MLCYDTLSYTTNPLSTCNLRHWLEGLYRRKKWNETGVWTNAQLRL